MCLNRSLPQEQLTKEHIIAAALAGTLTFDKSVCRQCAELGNKLFEQPALSTALLVPRLLIKLREDSTRKLPRVRQGNCVDRSIGADAMESIDIGLYPKFLTFLKLPVAGILNGTDSGECMRTIQIINISIEKYFPPDEVQNGYFTTTETMIAGAFELSLAKTAYFFAVATKGIDAFDGSEIRRLLRDERSDYLNFVGSPLTKERKISHELHSLSLRIRPGCLLTVIVHLFASYGVPPYEVVVGKIY